MLVKFVKSKLKGYFGVLISAVRISYENLYFMAICRKYSNVEEEVWVTGKNGRKLYCHIHRPFKGSRWPGLVLVPGGLDGGSIFDKWFCLNLRARDLASQGYVVIHFDPEGRGKSEGREDFGGLLHQSNLDSILEFFAGLDYVDSSNIGVVSFSLGLTIAAGTLARKGNYPKVKYLFDWEGPSNKHEITRKDRIEVFKEHPTSDEDFWSSREPIKYIGDVTCGYFRFQCRKDHVQLDYKKHAEDLLMGAVRGKAKWVICNGIKLGKDINERDLDDSLWIPYWSNQKLRMINYINRLSYNK
jgi:hypothetical protein